MSRAQKPLFCLEMVCNNKHGVSLQVHCVSAFGKLHEMLQQHAPFPQGLILHSWIGPAEMVDTLGKLHGVYFSLSGHLTRMSRKKYEPMVKRVSQPQLQLPCSIIELRVGKRPCAVKSHC